MLAVPRIAQRSIQGLPLLAFAHGLACNELTGEGGNCESPSKKARQQIYYEFKIPRKKCGDNFLWVWIDI